MDVALVSGGCEAGITPLAFAGFLFNESPFLREMTCPQKASAPFDKKLGRLIVMGEGAGIVVVESLDHAIARKAKIMPN